MLDKRIANLNESSLGPQTREVMECIEEVILDGLRHGHFQCRISSAIGNAGRRDLVVEAGKSHKFTIPKDELLGLTRTNGDP